VGDALGRSYTVGTVKPNEGDLEHVQVRRFNVDGGLLGSWLLATAARDQPLAVAADSTGALLVVGLTAGAFPGYTSAGGSDAFIARIAP
jgi:hypothetical protein